MPPILSVITPVGRPEYDYLHQSATSLTLLHRLLLKAFPEHDGMEWILSVDDPAIDHIDLINRVTAGNPQFFTIAYPSTGQFTGTGATRDRGLVHATGAWTLALDSDDIPIPHGVVAAIQTATWQNAAWIAGRAFDIDPDGNPLSEGPPDVFAPGVIPVGAFWGYIREHGVSPICLSAVIARTSELQRTGGWPTFRWREDSGMLAVLNGTLPGLWTTRYLMQYRQHPAAKTKSAEWAAASRPMDLIDVMIAEQNVHAILTEPTRAV